MPAREIPAYLLSVPERVLRSTAALTAGIVRELGDVALPGFVRKTRLYQTLVDSSLRFLIEQVGQVEGTYPSSEALAENFLLRRTAGNGLEMIGILAFRASPVWVLAALADLSGAGRTLVREIAAELKSEGLISADFEVETIDQLLDGLERTSARAAEAWNTPPLDVATLREEWQLLQRDFSSIPSPNLPDSGDIWQRWRALRDEAGRQNRSVFQVSSALALDAMSQVPENVLWLGKSAAHGAKRTGVVLAQALLDHYAGALVEMNEAGFLRYCTRQYKPYLRAAAQQFSPRKLSMIEKFLSRSLLLLGIGLVVPGVDWAQGRPKVAPVKRASASLRPVLPPQISRDALQSHVEFLASDFLEGRNTPSPGLSIASEYIAAQFRRLGLRPLTATNYFSEAPRAISFAEGVNTTTVKAENVSGKVPALIGRITKIGEAEELSRDEVRNRIIFTSPALAEYINENRETLLPRAIFALSLERSAEQEGIVYIWDPAAVERFEQWPEGQTQVSVSSRPAGLRNVVGTIPGSDPGLASECVLVTAHYDHVGMRPGTDDPVFNGANDNASGVAGVIETAAALVGAKPRRTVVFVTFFGEELGLLGSEYYSQNPACPIGSTVAQLNLEQIGRTDDTQGARVGAVTITGRDFSDLGTWIADAAATVGGKVDALTGESFFGRSDNLALAKLGVPAHTIATAYMFPDYHRPGDEAQKLDYDNMVLVTRIIAAGALATANNADTPRWRTENPKAQPYLKAATPLSKPREASAPKSGSSPASPRSRRSKPLPPR